MAIRQRTGRTKAWECYWNNPYTNKRESISFETKKEAEKQNDWIQFRLRYERDTFKPSEVKRASRQHKEPVKTLEWCYLEYLRDKKPDKIGMSTLQLSMKQPLLKFGKIPIEKITRQHIETVMLQMINTGIKPVTVRRRMTSLRAIMNWSRHRGFVAQVDFPRLPTARYTRFVPPTPEELQAMLQVAPDHIKRVITIGAQLGARVGQSELFSLRWEDVDFGKKILRIHGAKKNLDAPWREVPIRESLVPIFDEWYKTDKSRGIDYIINYKGNPVKDVKHAWEKTLKRAGITRKIRPYDLRHAFGTELVAAGVDVGTVAKLMGHSTPTMLLNHYQYVLDKQKSAAVEALPILHNVASCGQVHVAK